MQDLAGKTALVTGSNSGTGKVVAQQLAERGAHVILSGRDKARGDATAAETRLAEVTEVGNVIVIGSGPSGYTAAGAPPVTGSSSAVTTSRSTRRARAARRRSTRNAGWPAGNTDGPGRAGTIHRKLRGVIASGRDQGRDGRDLRG